MANIVVNRCRVIRNIFKFSGGGVTRSRFSTTSSVNKEYNDITKESYGVLHRHHGEQRGRMITSPLKAEWQTDARWEEGSRRTGVIAIKLGMIPQWTNAGQRFGVTLLQLQQCQVVKFLTEDEDPKRECSRLVVGARDASPFYRSADYTELFHEAGVPVKQRKFNFKISENAVIQPGTVLRAAHFRPGQLVDVTGITLGKGFEGVMKRWGMKGQPATHGQTKTHRRMGSAGPSGPQRILPGKKMPGPIGNRWIRQPRMKICRINTKYDVLYVAGTVPGHRDNFCYISDSLEQPKDFNKEDTLPFPTYYPDNITDTLPEDLYDENVFQFESETISYTD